MRRKTYITAIILTKNEEKNIVDCIESVKFCDEVVVIDDYSQDSTRKLAREKGARVLKRKLDNDFAKQRNIGLQKAKGDWALYVDADERVSAELKREIKTEMNRNGFEGFYLKRRDFIWGRELKYGETGKVKLLRLAKKKKGEWERGVHEVWNINIETKTLVNPLLHYPHPTLRGFLEELNWMSGLHAKENLKEGKKSNLLKIVILPTFKFIQNYFLRLGFLDGMQGFVLALTMSLHSYLAWSKLWLMKKNTQKKA